MNENLNKNTKKGKLQLSILNDELKLCIVLESYLLLRKWQWLAKKQIGSEMLFISFDLHWYYFLV